MQPINYSIGDQDAGNRFFKGYLQGIELKDIAAKKEQDQLMKKQLDNDISQLISGNPTAQDYSNLILKYPKLSESFQKSWDVLSEDQRSNKVQQTSEIYSSLVNNKPEIAENLLEKQIDAYKNVGNEKEAKALETFKEILKISPESAKVTAGLYLSNLMGPDKFAETYTKLQEGEITPITAQAKKAEAKIKELELLNAPNRILLENKEVESKISERAAKLGLDRDKLLLDYKDKIGALGTGAKLGPDALKIINEASSQSAIDEQSAEQKLDLANRIEKNLSGYGALSRGWEALKSVTGNEDMQTLIRQEYTRIRNSEAIRSLPPGPATDNDIKLALEGFPKPNADSGVLVQFLRGMSKLQKRDAEFNALKAEWVNEVGYLGKARQDVEVNGVQVPAGTNFGQFSSQYLNRSREKAKAEENAASIPSRSYMVFAQ